MKEAKIKFKRLYKYSSNKEKDGRIFSWNEK